MNTTNDKVEILLFKVQGVFQAQNLKEAERFKVCDGHNLKPPGVRQWEGAKVLSTKFKKQ